MDPRKRDPHQRPRQAPQGIAPFEHLLANVTPLRKRHCIALASLSKDTLTIYLGWKLGPPLPPAQPELPETSLTQ
jgi:hypothetical protein